MICRSFVTPRSRYCYVAKVIYLALGCARSWRSVRQAYLCTYKALANEKKSARVGLTWVIRMYIITHIFPPLKRPSHYVFTGFKTWQVPTEKRWTQGFDCKRRVFRTSDELKFFWMCYVEFSANGHSWPTIDCRPQMWVHLRKFYAFVFICELRFFE